VTGLAVRQGIGLYDPEAQRELAVQVIGPIRAGRYRTPLDSNTHPPSEVWLPVLVSFLPWPQAADIWRGALHVGFLAAIVWVFLDLRRQGASKERLLLAVALAVWLIPVQTSVDFGQLDVPILLLLLLARDLYRRPNGAVWAGAAIGVAACLKPSPVLLLIYFLVRGDWRVIAGAVGAALAHVVLSGALLGPQVWFDWVFKVLPQLLGGSTNYANHTFNALSYHLFAEPRLLTSLAPPPALPAARALTTVLNVAVMGAAIFVTWKYARRWNAGAGSGRPLLAFELGYGLFILVTLVTSSLSWEHYYTWAYLPIAALLAPAAGVYRNWRDWPWLAAGLLAYGLIIMTPRFYLLPDLDQYSIHWVLRLLIPVKVYGSLLLSVLITRVLVAAPEMRH
jgi:alpha-1,2-mannosyltransferase